MAETFRIGVSLPQSGRDARNAWASHYNAYRLWLDEVNGRGGLLGRPVELVMLDDGSRPARAVQNYERLIADGQVDLLMAPARTRSIEQVAPVTEQAQRLLLVGHGSGHAMFQQGRKYLFLGWPGTDFDVPRSFFEWADALPGERRPRRAALLHPHDPRPSYTDDPYHGINQHNTGILLGTRHYAAQFGVELVHEADYTDEPSSYGALFDDVKAAGPDVVLVANYALQRGADQLTAFVEAFRAADLDDAFLWLYRVPSVVHMAERGDDPLNAAIARTEPLYEGIFTFDQWDSRSPNGMARRFVEAFVEAHDYVPDSIAAGVYVACQLLEQSVEATGTCDNDQLRGYLLDNSFETVMGSYRFQGNGVPLARMLLLQAVEGQLEVVHPDSDRTADPVLP